MTTKYAKSVPQNFNLGIHNSTSQNRNNIFSIHSTLLCLSMGKYLYSKCIFSIISGY